MSILETIQDGSGGGAPVCGCPLGHTTKKMGWASRELAAECMRKRDEKGAAASTASPGSLDGSLHLVAARMARR